MHSGSFCEVTACTLKRRQQLTDALMEVTGGLGEISEHSAKPWASITFSGSRHKVVMDFEGSDAVEAGELLLDRLPDHEFAIPGQLVADAEITGVTHIAMMPALIVHAEILLLEEE